MAFLVRGHSKISFHWSWCSPRGHSLLGLALHVTVAFLDKCGIVLAPLSPLDLPVASILFP